MNISRISAGRDVPWDLNIVVEIPQGSSVKYEMDKESGALFVDRFLFTPMVYPAAYGFIPNTLAADGDPTDALVLTPAAVAPGTVIRARPIGMLMMEDENGQDEKIICVPHDRMHALFASIARTDELPEITRAAIEHFFCHYKDLEPDKWVKITRWLGTDAAAASVRDALHAAGHPLLDT